MTFALYLVAVVLGTLGAALVGLLYSGQTSFADASLEQILSAPAATLAAPFFVTTLVASSIVGVQGDRRLDEQVVGTLGFMAGCVFGVVAGVVLFIWLPSPGYGFAWHAGSGLVLGGTLGGGTAYFAFRIAG